MLVLSRKEGERVVIGDNITIVVSRISGNRVTLGIEAPRDVKVVRGELEIEVDLTEETVNSDTQPVSAGPLASRLVSSKIVPGSVTSSNVRSGKLYSLKIKAEADTLALQRDVG